MQNENSSLCNASSDLISFHLLQIAINSVFALRWGVKCVNDIGRWYMNEKLYKRKIWVVYFNGDR